MLIRHMLKVGSHVGRGCDSELGSDASPVLGTRGTKEANKPMHLVGLLCPLSSCCRSAGGGQSSKRGGRDAIVNQSLNALGLVHGNEVVESGSCPRILGKDASGQLHSSEKELAAWLQRVLRRNVVRQGVGGVSAVWADSLGYGSGKSRQDSFCWGAQLLSRKAQ